MAVYVLVHGAWHDGTLFEPLADLIRAHGHVVHCPTVAGNNPGDDKGTGLDTAIASIVSFLEDENLRDVVLLGHSYGGMVITGVADRAGDRIKRLIYWNAFVPNHGESLNDMVPQGFQDMFDGIAAASGDNSLTMPYPIWREAFMNDGTGALAQEVYDKLNPHPYATFTDKIHLSKSPAEMEIGKSYINGINDAALPQSMGWHPRLSEKLGLFRLVQYMGGHEACFTCPEALAEAILTAGDD